MSFLGNFYGGWGYFRHIGGYLDQACRYYEKGDQKGMSKPKYLSAYGVALLRQGDFAKAKELLERALAVPDRAPAAVHGDEMNLAVTLWKLGESDRAIEMLRQLEVDYPSAAVFGSLGYILLDVGKEDEALEYNLKKLEEYDENDAVLLDTVGQIHYRRGEFEKAAEYFEKAIANRPNMVDSLYYLGLLEADKGNLRRARAMLSRAQRQPISSLNTVTGEMLEQAADQINAAYDALSPEEQQAQAPENLRAQAQAQQKAEEEKDKPDQKIKL